MTCPSVVHVCVLLSSENNTAGPLFMRSAGSGLLSQTYLQIVAGLHKEIDKKVYLSNSLPETICL